MASTHHDHNVQSLDSINTETNTAPSDHSTPTMSEKVDGDIEKGIHPDKHPMDSDTSMPEKDVRAEAALEDGENAVPIPALPPGPGPPPDGGAQAWMSVLGAFCGLFVSFGWINCVGVFQTYYETHQLSDLSTSTVTWITSLETFVMFFAGPVFGTLFDSFGPRWILLGGTILHVLGLMMTSLSTEYYQFILAQGICSPIGASAIFNASINSVSTWFAKRRAFALGVTASGSSLGGVIFPIMVTQLIPKVGFPWAMRICAFLILFMLVIANLTLRSRSVHSKKQLQMMNFVRPLKDIKFVITVAAAFCFFWGMFLPFTFIITQAQRYGMSQHLSEYLIPILNAASIFGRTLPGYLADRVGRYNVMIFFSFLSSILVLALWLPSRSNAPAIVFSALYGFGSGAFVSLAPALIAQISDLREVGVRNGTCFSIISFAALTGTPIGGALVSNVLQGSYTRLQVFCGVVMMAGACLFVVARIVVGGAKLGKV
ncbi:MFS transporter asaE [Penicillium macrosclerotiorum]|uniref:MFS transporter asaE n=1 Tax=Penicillium macrosclerotiorum TaxID=303699 RepID=UPI0025497C76|nr:MFS transporter asaE [Penicillium macrosclerotiorum]KAJ5679777.1 MFS transporter asaE [Penicillium macrosclerotiorum]